jgi:hypothetical protein
MIAAKAAPDASSMPVPALSMMDKGQSSGHYRPANAHSHVPAGPLAWTEALTLPPVDQPLPAIPGIFPRRLRF